MSVGVRGPVQNEKVVLARRPNGVPREGDFRFEKDVLCQPTSGQTLVENIFDENPSPQIPLNELGTRGFVLLDPVPNDKSLYTDTTVD